MGQCFIDNTYFLGPYNSNDSVACRTMSDNNCVACNTGFDAVKVSSQPLIVNCVQQINGNAYCLVFDDKKQCTKCVLRMYPSNGTCVGIDPNC